MIEEIDYNKTQPIIELYRAIQSEGSKAGIPHIIVRTTGCTHRCWFGEGGWCDTWYSSIAPEKGKFTLNNIKMFFKDNLDITHLMLTGGSPTMHPELCNEIINIFKEIHSSETEFGFSVVKNSHGIVTIETEGSHFIQTDHKIDLVSFSPKFSNSIPKVGIKTPTGLEVNRKFIEQHNKYRLNKEAIKQMMDYHSDYHFKPVVNPIEMPKIWDEIEAFREEMNIPKSKTWIMPPGDNREELIRVYPMIIRFCTDNGFNFSSRDHIIAFGNLKGI